MRVFVTGANGQIGSAVVKRFRQSTNHEVVAPTRADFDLTNRDSILGAITTSQPDAIVHAAAMTGVDACELQPDDAFRCNALATRHVVDAATRAGARVLYLSTDYVFDGESTRPYNEWDVPNPKSVYGRSKRGGECELRSCDTVVRTSWVFGDNGNNMVRTVLRLAQSQETLQFVDDQHGKPTYATDIAETIYDLVVARQPGVFHVTNETATTWFQFARDILQIIGGDPERVFPISSSELGSNFVAPRPANSVLDNAALRLSGGRLLRDHHEALIDAVQRIRAAPE